jgi:hypothetical protein
VMKFAIAPLVAVALAQPAPSIAGGMPTDSGAKPNSYVPQPHTNQHVYGSPIGPAIMGRAKNSHQHAPKKRSSGAAKSTHT